MDHLKALNEAQKEAAQTLEGPVLVLAGAGAGKTRTIAHRVVHLVKSGVAPEHILAITFTNKAAHEMRDRIASLIRAHGGAARHPTVCTFHALGVRTLREFAKDAGVDPRFTIYDRQDSIRAIKRALRASGEDDKRFEPRTVLGTISRAKGDARTLGEYRESTGNAYYETVVAGVWAAYDRILRSEHALDFDDLLLETWRLLSTKPHVLATLSERYRYVHIDEYQDTNKVQYEIVRLLAGAHKNLFCVGDLDQNVYAWRGATVDNILGFEEAFPGAVVLKLEENYRSTQTIVSISNDIIQKNVRRKEKTLFTKNPVGEKCSLLVGYDEHHEATQVVEAIDDLLAAGVPAHEIAVLYRANFQSRVLEESCLAAGVPYRVLGTRFFDRKEVKDVLAYARAALNPASRTDVQRVINTPTRGIGKVTTDRLFAHGRDALTGTARARVDGFYHLLEEIRKRAESTPASETISFILERSGIGATLAAQDAEEVDRVENMRELVSLAAGRYDALGAPEGLLRLLEDAALATDQDELDRRTDRGGSRVSLMTIHAAKGLEFSHVFITGLEDGLFPHERNEFDPRSHADDEEERRLFYVALTRAKEKLYLCYAQARTIFGERSQTVPSEFLLDIDETFIEAPAVPTTGKVVYLD